MSSRATVLWLFTIPLVYSFEYVGIDTFHLTESNDTPFQHQIIMQTQINNSLFTISQIGLFSN